MNLDCVAECGISGDPSTQTAEDIEGGRPDNRNDWLWKCFTCGEYEIVSSSNLAPPRCPNGHGGNTELTLYPYRK